MSDWLDALALRAVPRAPVAGPAATWSDDDLPDTIGNRPLTRPAAVKVGVAAFAALAFGLGRSAAAAAQDQGSCYLECGQRYIDAAEQNVKACEDLYAKPGSVFEGKVGWAGFLSAAKDGHWNFVGDAANELMKQACIRRAVNRMSDGLDRCNAACKETCPQPKRTTSGIGIFDSTCHGTQPPKSVPPPPTPPPPDASNSSCDPCMAVAGVCCGPGPPGKPPCGCAGYYPDDGTDPCKRLGC